MSLVVLALTTDACGDSPTTPSQSVVPTTPPPIVQSITITAPGPLTAIGQTAQLTATAAYSDSTTKDVTTSATWRSMNPSVVTVSSNGIVTVVGFGASSIQAEFQTRVAFLFLTATPQNTLVFYGRVREPGAGGISGVRVVETQSGQVTFTDSGGNYSLGALTTARLTFDKEGYEPVPQLDALPNQFNDVPLQRIVRVTAGGSVTDLTLAPHDVSHIVGSDRCYPCKLIRVTMPTRGTLRVNLTWNEPRANRLNVWVDGARLVGDGISLNITRDIAVGSGEVLVYVGFYDLYTVPVGSGLSVPFSLATSTGGSP
jgi:hypothetical protein